MVPEWKAENGDDDETNGKRVIVIMKEVEIARRCERGTDGRQWRDELASQSGETDRERARGRGGV